MERKIFKKILSLCFDEDFPELHRELLSIEVSVKRNNDYARGIEEAYNAIPLYAEDFPEDVYEEIEILYEDYLDSLES
jgi:hypothetical protein